MNQKRNRIIKWCISIFFLLSTLVYFPSVASIFMAVLGVFLLPVAPVENFVKKIIKPKWLRIVIAIILFLIALSFVPDQPDTSNITSPTETTVPDATSPTIATTDDATDETMGYATEETSVPTESLVITPTEATTETIVPQDSSFAVHFIDVGQADAALILCDGQAMLIDSGNAEDSNLIYAYLKKHNITYLDYVVGTHAHEDHIGGIAGALNYASPGIVYCPVTTYDSKAFKNFTKAVDKHEKAITIPSVGTTFNLGSANCKILAVNTDSDTNNSSIVLRIVYGETSFLFTGDAEREVEQAILNRNETLKSTVLKVGHHGSDTSTSYVFLREIMPQYAVISVGKGNSYGHPTEATLSRLRDADTTLFRTDLQGDIICTSDGKQVSFSVSRNANADVFDGLAENSTVSTSPTTPPAPTTTPTTAPTTTPTTAPTESHEDPVSDMVWIPKSGKKYHSHAECSNMKNPKQVTREEAEEAGYTRCSKCW